MYLAVQVRYEVGPVTVGGIGCAVDHRTPDTVVVFSEKTRDVVGRGGCVEPGGEIGCMGG